MSIQDLCELVFTPIEDSDTWRERCESALTGLFSGSGSRYYERALDSKCRPRINASLSDKSVPYAALIHPDNPDSGAYGGMSFVLFPAKASSRDESEDDGLGTAAFGLVVGTRGLHPDEEVLARPGHARKSQAIARWLNAEWSGAEQVAWAKGNPVRTDQDLPSTAGRLFRGLGRAAEKYGPEIYTVFRPTREDGEAQEVTEAALKAYLDLMARERGVPLMSGAAREADRHRNAYLDEVFETTSRDEVFQRLKDRKYVILEGPPGTGKTRLADQIREGESFYDGRGQSVQFHPNTTYESFVGGLAPVQTDHDLGFQFEPSPGSLMRAADRAAQVAPAPYLLHIDEINRADLAKVLGEAVYLFEYRQFQDGDEQRRLELEHDFSGKVEGESIEDGFGLPENLHVLGTMNTSDRSIAHLDVAIRRRFAFLKMWPRHQALWEFFDRLHEEDAAEALRSLVLGDETESPYPPANLFGRLVSIFVDFAPEDAVDLMPGHSYFLADSVEELMQRMRGELVPLLEQYIREGHVAGFADELQSYIQQVRALGDGTS